jgi:hypothetical protein
MDLRFVFFQSFQGQGRADGPRSAAQGQAGHRIAPQPAHTSTASETDKGQGCSKLPSVTVHGAACAPPSSSAAHSADGVMLGCKKGPALAGMHAPSMTCAKAGRPVVCLAGCSWRLVLMMALRRRTAACPAGHQPGDSCTASLCRHRGTATSNRYGHVRNHAGSKQPKVDVNMDVMGT